MRQHGGKLWQRRLAGLWLLALVMVAVLAPYLPLPYPPAVPDLQHVAAPPFRAAHWLGTDAQGQDILTSLVFGARTAVLLTLPAAALAALLGGVAGGVAGYWGNHARLSLPYGLALVAAGWGISCLPGYWYACGVAVVAGLARALPPSVIGAHVWPTLRLPLDAALQGTITLLGAVPRLLVAVVIASQGTSSAQLLLVLALLAWPDMARLVRAQMLRVRVLPFIDAARAAGIPGGQLWWRHALPHALQPLRTAFPLSIATLLGLETTLSFLGVGLSPTVPSWGRMLASARLNPFTYTTALYPISALLLSIISLNIIAKSRQLIPSNTLFTNVLWKNKNHV